MEDFFKFCGLLRISELYTQYLYYTILHTQSSRLEKKVLPPPPSRRCRRRRMTSKFEDSMGNRLCLRALFPLLPSPSKSLVLHTYFLLVFFVATASNNRRSPFPFGFDPPNLIQHAFWGAGRCLCAHCQFSFTIHSTSSLISNHNMTEISCFWGRNA